MPTKRAWVWLTLALVFYLLANQTQVGWIYIFSNALLGLLSGAFFYQRGLLKAITVERSLSRVPTGFTAGDATPADLEQGHDGAGMTWPEAGLAFHEDDPIEVTLRFEQRGLRPAFLVGGDESCPFAPEADRAQPLFIPTLFRGQRLDLTYRTICDRRGVYTFPLLNLRSTGPFGFFKSHRRLAVPTELLIYPFYHPLKGLRILERRDFASRPAQRVGPGSQVIGTRDYRSGDSLRLVHWRSTARTGSLVVKEFTDDEDMTLTVVLDLHRPASMRPGKFSPFETAVRLAASLGYYATRKKVPFFLLGASRNGSPPPGALSWWACLNYLAKVKNDGHQPLEGLLAHLSTPSFFVILINQASQPVVKALLTRQRRGLQTLPIFITPGGEMPSAARAIKGAVSVSPHNWVDILRGL